MRTAYVLTAGVVPQRAERTKHILSKLGFNVKIVLALDRNCSECQGSAIISNYVSFENILKEFMTTTDEWSYFFEDDIDLVEPIGINTILQYENISSKLFYLGCCLPSSFNQSVVATDHVIEGHVVYRLTTNICCLHAIAFSKAGAALLLYELKNKIPNWPADAITGRLPLKIPDIHGVRLDLISPQDRSHRGIFFQDRLNFKSEIW